MTSLQVEYWKLEETKRTNVVHEKIDWKNAAAHMLQAKAAMASVGESHRHNVAMENLGWAQLAEQTRHSMATEQLGQFEADTRRISVQNDFTIRSQQVEVQRSEAQTAQFNADTKRLEFYLYEQTKWKELSQEDQRIAQNEERIQIEKSENIRQWVNTGLNGVSGSNKKKKDSDDKGLFESLMGLFMN